MTQQSLTEEQLAELAEIAELAKAAEQKAKEISELAKRDHAKISTTLASISTDSYRRTRELS
jgi:hypothetical protein